VKIEAGDDNLEAIIRAGVEPQEIQMTNPDPEVPEPAVPVTPDPGLPDPDAPAVPPAVPEVDPGDLAPPLPEEDIDLGRPKGEPDER